jgi:hypothetical protein
VDVVTEQWPTAELSDIARLHLLAEGLPGATVHERVIDRPFAEVWDFVSRLEESVPRFDSDVRRLRIRRSEPTPDGGRRLDIVATAPWWLAWFPARFDVDLRDGWCWMVSRPQAYVVGMAAVAEGERTRFAHLEGMTFRAPRPVARLLAPVHRLSRWRHRHHIPHDVDGIERALTLVVQN